MGRRRLKKKKSDRSARKKIENKEITGKSRSKEEKRGGKKSKWRNRWD